MQEQIINFQTAKLAKEKGFNICLNQYWCNEVLSDKFQQTIDWNNVAKSHISAPTQALLQKWLREVHKIHISLHFNRGASWTYLLSELSYDGSWTKDYPEHNYESYESALEDGLYHALQLIK